jgi:NodT family efflux transporter outer membrane factor (OMF) lipoprotein
MSRRLLLPLLPLLLLAPACRPVGPTYTAPRAALPERYAADRDAPAAPRGRAANPAEASWWEAWGDPPLDALVRRALQASPDLRAAEARLRQARAAQGVQDAASGPNLGLGAKVTRDRLSRNGEMLANNPSPKVETDFTNHQVGFDASWEVDLFGRQRRLSEAASARTQASAARLQDLRLVLAAEVARNYVDYRAGQARLLLAQGQLADHDETLRLLRLAVQTGDQARQELGKAEAARSRQAAALAALQTGLRQSLAALTVLADLSLEDLEARLGPARPLAEPPSAPGAGLPSELLRQRPDLRAAERELAAATADLGVAIADRLPRFSLLGNGGWSSVSSGSLLSTASTFWNAGPQLSLPLFSRGRLKQQVKASEAARDAAEAAYRKAVLAAVADAEVALVRLGRCEESRRGMEEAEAACRQVLALTEAQVQAGELSRFPLLEARRALQAQQDQAVQARAGSLVALASLHKALGGSW